MEAKTINVKDLGKVLCDLRKRKGLTQTKLSELTKIPRSSISKVETNKRIVKFHELLRLAEACGFDIVIKNNKLEACLIKLEDKRKKKNASL